MNTLTRAIALLIALSMLMSGLALAQDAPAAETREVDVARREAEIAFREAQKQAEAAQKQAETVRKQRDASLMQADIALAKARSMPAPVVASTGISTISRGHWPSRSGNGAGAVLVIPSAQIKTEDIVTINEDMNVMSRIFDKQLAKARLARSPG